MLVNFKKGLSDEQKVYLARKFQSEIFILGGTSAVSEDTEKFIDGLGNKFERLGGADRYATSLLIAEKFAPDADKAVLAISNQFTDGLCGSMLAVDIKAPLILTKTGKEDVTGAYTKEKGISATLGVIFPIIVFAYCGFDHSVANMLHFFYLGEFSWRVVGYIAVSIAGNIIGGVIFPCITAFRKYAERKRAEQAQEQPSYIDD
jgi:hypothetical protein